MVGGMEVTVNSRPTPGMAEEVKNRAGSLQSEDGNNAG